MSSIRTAESDRARFWAKVDKNGPVPSHDPSIGSCWIWTAARFSNGYGAFRLGPKQRRAHVVSYEWAVGPVPSGQQVQHACNVKACVNPAHLSLGDQKRNIEYALSLGRMASGVRSGMHTHGLTKLSDSDVTEIRRLAGLGVFQEDLANQFGVTQTMISRIILGRAWQHLVPDGQVLKQSAGKPRPSDDTVRAVRRMASEGASQGKIALACGMSQPAVSRILNRVAYAHVV